MLARTLVAPRGALLACALLLGVGCARSSTTPAAPTLPRPPRAQVLAAATPPAKRLVVFLHGYGDSAEGFLPLARAIVADLPDAEGLVPDALHPREAGGSGRQWFSRLDVTEQNRPARVAEAGRAVSAWLDGELHARGLGAGQLVLVGFSQGAMLAQWLALHRSPAPAAVVSLGGLLAVDGEPRAAPGARVLLVHGDADPVVPVQASHAALPRLQSLGVDARLQVIPGLGHGVDARALAAVRAFLAPPR